MGDVICASVQMLHYASFDRVNASPRHDGVHQAVTSAVRDIIVCET